MKGVGELEAGGPPPCMSGRSAALSGGAGERQDANLSILDPQGGKSTHEAVSRWTLLPPGLDCFHTLMLTVRTGSVNSQLGMFHAQELLSPEACAIPSVDNSDPRA